MPRILAVIPARGGSKGLPRKNVRLLDGHPLIAYSIAAGCQCPLISRTICSTDDQEIAEVARRYGAEVPFLRPAALAQDDTLDLPVMQHALRWLQENEGWSADILVQLRPTSPLRSPGLVGRAVQALLDDPHATAVRTICPAPANPHKMWRLPVGAEEAPYMRNLLDVPGLAEPYNEPRQKLPPVWWQTGTVDVVRAEVVLAGSMTGGRILPCSVEPALSVDIDDEDGLRRAEAVVHTADTVRPGAPLRWDAVKLLALDVDGTLTPGTMYYDADGEALKRFHTHDGQGIALARRAGVAVAIITAEDTPIAPARARKLGLDLVRIGVKEKLPVLRELAAGMAVSLAQVCYVGDDLGDVSCLEAVKAEGGIACAVADARPEARRAANWLAHRKGGEGAVRDVCDRLVAAANPL